MLLSTAHAKHFKHVPLSNHWVEVSCIKLNMHYLPSRNRSRIWIYLPCPGWSCRRGGMAFVLVWGCAWGYLFREHLCRGALGDPGGSLVLGGVAFVGFPWLFWAGCILFCRKCLGVAKDIRWGARVAFRTGFIYCSSGGSQTSLFTVVCHVPG